jgi:hypothetical protein
VRDLDSEKQNREHQNDRKEHLEEKPSDDADLRVESSSDWEEGHKQASQPELREDSID